MTMHSHIVAIPVASQSVKFDGDPDQHAQRRQRKDRAEHEGTDAEHEEFLSSRPDALGLLEPT